MEDMACSRGQQQDIETKAGFLVLSRTAQAVLFKKSMASLARAKKELRQVVMMVPRRVRGPSGGSAPDGKRTMASQAWLRASLQQLSRQVRDLSEQEYLCRKDCEWHLYAS